MLDISVVILVGREERHIRRCLEKLAPLEPRQVMVVESQTGDWTHEIVSQTASQLGWRSEKWEVRSEKCEVRSEKWEVRSEKCEVRSEKLNNEVKPSQLLTAHHSPLTSHGSLLTVFRPWPGTQAAQFNWALDNLPIEGEWVLRLDADEYLTDETIAALRSRLEVKVDSGGSGSACRACEDTGETGIGNAAGLTLELKRRFCGGEIRHATNGIRQVRLFRRGRARYADGLMDERLVVDGAVDDFDGAFCDDNLSSMDWWREKHRGYAKREAAQALVGLRTGQWTDPRKAAYYRLPPYVRAFAYFCIRYFLRLGFLDGRAGWMWNFWQGLWYRCLVDREIGRMKRGED